MLIATMIARNEENNFLEEVLQHTSKFADQIVVVDDNSDDETANIAREYGYVYRAEGPGSMFDREGEHAIRDYLEESLSNHAQRGDWIVALNADEFFYPTPHYRELMSQTLHKRTKDNELVEFPKYNVIGTTMYHMWDETHFRTDMAWRPKNIVRFYRYLPNGKMPEFKFACHPAPTYARLMAESTGMFQLSGFEIKHMGFSTPELREQKHKWYTEKNQEHGRPYSNYHINSMLDKRPRELMEWNEKDLSWLEEQENMEEATWPTK